MSQFSLTKTRMKEGVWEGVLRRVEAGEEAPQVEVTLDNATLAGVEVIDDQAGGWVLRVPVPAEAIADGIQTFLIRDKASGGKLDSFALLAGDALGDDIRAEIDLLRAELDMLKRAFRRHCLETM
jgi:hypothetical protein